MRWALYGALAVVALSACAESDPPQVIPPMAGMTAGTEVPPGGETSGTIPGACVNDTTCAPGTVCNATGMCVPGQCSLSTPCPAGQTCDYNTFMCSGASTPACTSDDNCAAGFCVAGMCQDVECVRDTNCAMGTRCEGMRCVADTGCIDGDRDGYGTNCPSGPDCDDANANVNPGTPENGATNCNDGVDNNCDGVDSICGSDEDLDNDGYADKDGDCDDMNPDVNPGRREVYYNDLDDDCNPNTNDDDQDGDGFAAEMSGGPDCDDTNAAINPAAQDTPMNGVDEDCDGMDRTITDDDRDGDGVSEAQGDCDDDNANISPNNEEIPYNSLDDDCDSSTRDNDLDRDGFTAPTDCDDMNANVNPNIAEVFYNGQDDDCDPATKDGDADGDGYNAMIAGGNDCNDDVASVNPDAEEITYNGLDDDCDPSTRDNDLDADGFDRDVDCDDQNPEINPDVIENLTTNCSDGVDNDCVGGDVRCDAGASDRDGDGIPDDQDCEPDNPDVPGLAEIPGNGIDDDCDGQVDTAPCDDDGFDVAASNSTPDTASSVADGNTVATQYGDLILCPEDTDWYQITLNAGDGIEVDFGFDHDEGDIDVVLYRSDNGVLTEEGMRRLDNSASASDKEVVYSARATVRDTYYIKVYHFSAPEEGQAYRMTVNVFEGCQDDLEGASGEHNDTADEASNMPPIGATRQICDYDHDWYRFSLDRQQDVRIDVLFPHSAGDIDAQLSRVDGNGTIDFGISVDDNEVLEAEDLPPGDYLVKVYGLRDVQNQYRIFKTSGTISTSTYTNNTDQDLIDAGENAGVFTSEVIRFDAVPAGAIVRQLKLKQLDINHRCLADLRVTLKWDGEPITTLWNRQGENCLDGGLDDDSALSVGCFGGVGAARWNGRLGNDICFEDREYSEFGGLDAQGELTVEIIDYNQDNDGTLVNLDFELEFLLP